MLLPTPLDPTNATISPRRDRRRDAAEDRLAGEVLELQVPQLERPAAAAAAPIAPGASRTAGSVSSTSKTRRACTAALGQRRAAAGQLVQRLVELARGRQKQYSLPIVIPAAPSAARQDLVAIRPGNRRSRGSAPCPGRGSWSPPACRSPRASDAEHEPDGAADRAAEAAVLVPLAPNACVSQSDAIDRWIAVIRPMSASFASTHLRVERLLRPLVRQHEQRDGRPSTSAPAPSSSRT